MNFCKQSEAPVVKCCIQANVIHAIPVTKSIWQSNTKQMLRRTGLLKHTCKLSVLFCAPLWIWNCSHQEGTPELAYSRAGEVAGGCYSLCVREPKMVYNSRNAFSKCFLSFSKMEKSYMYVMKFLRSYFFSSVLNLRPFLFSAKNFWLSCFFREMKILAYIKGIWMLCVY